MVKSSIEMIQIKSMYKYMYTLSDTLTYQYCMLITLQL